MRGSTASTDHPNRKMDRPVQWVDICRVFKLMGLQEGYSKAECFRTFDQLKARMAAGKVKRVRRGFYQVES